MICLLDRNILDRLYDFLRKSFRNCMLSYEDYVAWLINRLHESITGKNVNRLKKIIVIPSNVHEHVNALLNFYSK